jgi:ribosomal protein L40E
VSANVENTHPAPAVVRGGWSRLRSWAIALGGAGFALLYGIFGAGLGAGAPLLMMTVGGLSLALCGLALFRVLDPLVRPAAAAQRQERATESTRLRELEREKQLVLKAIREIEHDYQMRKISEADHKELTERYRARALRLINQIDAGDDFRTLIEQELKTRLVAMEAARSACVACGAANEVDARFCKKCGKALAAEAAPAESAP